MTKDEDELNELRKYLIGVTWGDFEKHHCIYFPGYEHPFLARFGLLLGEPTLAIIVNGKFVVTQFVPHVKTFGGVYKKLPVLDPKNLPAVFIPESLPFTLGATGQSHPVLEKMPEYDKR